MAAGASPNLYAIQFEVFGKVQKVFFRKHTEKEAKKLGLNGWCMNTPEGTVKGVLEGPMGAIDEMQQWLRTKGSPKSRIDKTVFSEAKELRDYNFKSFFIRA